MHFILIFYIFK